MGSAALKDGRSGELVEALNIGPADREVTEGLSAPAGLLFDEAGRLLIASTTSAPGSRRDVLSAVYVRQDSLLERRPRRSVGPTVDMPSIEDEDDVIFWHDE